MLSTSSYSKSGKEDCNGREEGWEDSVGGRMKARGE